MPKPGHHFLKMQPFQGFCAENGTVVFRGCLSVCFRAFKLLPTFFCPHSEQAKPLRGMRQYPLGSDLPSPLKGSTIANIEESLRVIALPKDQAKPLRNLLVTSCNRVTMNDHRWQCYENDDNVVTLMTMLWNRWQCCETEDYISLNRKQCSQHDIHVLIPSQLPHPPTPFLITRLIDDNIHAYIGDNVVKPMNMLWNRTLHIMRSMNGNINSPKRRPVRKPTAHTSMSVGSQQCTCFQNCGTALFFSQFQFHKLTYARKLSNNST